MTGVAPIALIRASLWLALLGYNLSAFSPLNIGHLLSSPIDAIATKVAAALGGKCWSVASWNVQVRGKPMCLAGSGNPDFDAGRSARLAAIKALGMTFATFSVRNIAETNVTDAEQRIQTFASMIHATLDRAIHVDLPSTLLGRLLTPSSAARTQYVISDASLDVLASIRGDHDRGMALTDPYEAALVGRTLAASASLEQATSDVAQSLDPRTQAIATNVAGETEATRLQAEAAATRTYLDGARTATRGGTVELQTLLALKREMRAQVTTSVDNTIQNGVQ